MLTARSSKYLSEELLVRATRLGLNLGPGLLLALTIAAAAALSTKSQAAQQIGVGTLTIAMIFGLAIGNSLFTRLHGLCAPGVDFAKAHLLRVGIVLYGFRITFQEVAIVGWAGALAAVVVVAVTFLLTLTLGQRLFKLNTETSVLIGAGSAICGAAAIMATAPVIRSRAESVSIAVATIVVFGTISMFIYPALYPYIGLSEHEYGVFVGSTVHEVAQVVVAGSAVSDASAGAAVVEKMIRVMLLAPFLLILSMRVAPDTERAGKGFGAVTVPWFAVLFLVMTGINSSAMLPDPIVEMLVALDTVLLAMAMAALGLRTSLKSMHQAGLRPLMLGAMIGLVLLVGGYLLNVGIWLLTH